MASSPWTQAVLSFSRWFADEGWGTLSTAWLAMGLTAVVSANSASLQWMAQYGRHRTSSSSPSSPSSLHSWLSSFADWTVSKDRFFDFYVVGFVWNTVVLLAALTALHEVMDQRFGSTVPRPLWVFVPSALYQVHCLRRLLENFFVHVAPKASSNPPQMHVLGYVVGVLHYVLGPLTVLAPVWLRLARSDSLGRESPIQWVSDALSSSSSSLAHLVTPLLWLVCVAAFGVMNALQYHAHAHLAALRRDPVVAQQTVHAGRYALPYAGLFEFVSCPHFFAEIVLYIALLGFSILSAGSLSAARVAGSVAAAMLFWVVTNLTVTALQTHAWYQSTFPTFPAHRRALIPFLL